MNLSLSQKGLLLVGIPTGLMLLFLVVLFLLLLKVEREAMEVDRSKTIIYTANSLVKQNYDAANHLVIFKQKKTEEDLQQTREILNETEDTFQRLKGLVKDDPVEQRQLEKLRKISDVGRSFMERYIRHITREEKLNELEVTVLFGELNETGKIFTSKLNEMITHETAKHRISSKEEKGTRALLYSLIFVGAVSSIAVGVVLARSFNKGTSSRLELLMDNTVRLGKKEALLPKLDGDDEISKLDLFFHKMADDLAEATRKERAILDNAVDVICSISTDGKFTAVNPASLQIWGLESEKLIGTSVTEILVKEDQVKFNEVLSIEHKDSELINLENRVVASSGVPVHMLWSIRWSEREHSMFCVAHDISDRKEVERLKQEFVAVVSHELRTPLTSLEMTLSLLQNGTYGPISETAQKRVKSAEVGISRLVMLISDLLDMEKMEAGKLSMKLVNTDLVEVIERSSEAISGYAEQQGVKIAAEVGLELCNARADSDRLVQVLVNLLSNAVKYSDDGAQIEIELERGTEFAEIRVIDHGMGIPEGYEEAIFAKYEQAHLPKNKRTRSTGLGLPICKAIVEQHNGTIGVRRTEGGGSTFWFRIPRAS